MKCALFSANEWLYPDRQAAGFGNNRIRIACARGSFASCQLLVGPVPKGAAIRWQSCFDRIASLNDTAGGIVPELFQLIDVAVPLNTGPENYTVGEGEQAGGHVTRAAPFNVYDAMKPIQQSCCISRSEQEAFYVRFRIASHANPGIYTCRLSIEAGPVRCEAFIEIEVFRAIVPVRETLCVSNWFNPGLMADRHGLQPWSEEHWEMIASYAGMMRHVRQTHFLVPIELVQFERSEGGQLRFRFDRVKRFIQLFFRLGFKVIEGGPVAVQLQLGDPHFMLKTDPAVWACSAEGYAFLAQYLQAWYGFLKDNGWLEQTVQHAADEPFAASMNDYRSIVCMVRKHMPGVKVIEAVCTSQVEGTADILIPTNQYYEEHRDPFEQLRTLGHTLWFYTCSVPGGYYMNRLMDIPLLKTRLLHWGNFMYRLEGYLHWGFNGYRPGQDPFADNCPEHTAHAERKRLPAGDTHIVYPGEDGPWGSVRLEAMRAGIEDYELLNMLEDKDQSAAYDILQAVMRSFSDSCSSAIAFDALHEKLLKALSQGA